MKFNLILAAALVAGVISTQAAGETAATNNTASSAMKALFGDPVIVKATGFELKRSDLDQILTPAKANAMAAGQALPPAFEVGVMNQLITIQLLLQKATDADRATGKTEAEDQFAKLVKRFDTPEAFQRQLKTANITEAELRKKGMEEATARTALKRELKINITDADARAFYDDKANSAEFEMPESAHVRHILLMTIDPATRTQLSSNAIAAKQTQIEGLLKRAKAGEDFAKLAKEFSEDEGTKANGGELPEFRKGQMVPEFESAAFNLSSNQISAVIKTDFGFHLIKAISDKTPAKKIEFDKVSSSLKDYLIGQKIAKLAPDYVKKLREEAKVEILDSALKKLHDEAVAAEAAAAAAAPATSAPNK